MAKDQDKIKILSKNLFPVVGIGASAGGLNAFRALIRAIPEDSGMAYILVQHLHPEYTSNLVPILQRESKIPVDEIVDNVHVEPDHIYIIPANKILVATDGILQLSPRPKNEKNMPIDIFFTSLAEIHQSHSIGVVLSGTGTDGTLGLTHIKDYNGVTFAEDPSTAGYDGMPQNAINANVVDFVLPPEKIPHEILKVNDTFHRYGGENSIPENAEEDNFKQIISLLRVKKNVDFTYYKQTTIKRRILRRMVILKCDKLAEYLDHLKKNKDELDFLFQDLLIPVTSFFRDPEVFDKMCQSVFPQLLKEKTQANPLRIWITGCSTGQEAYSMGMCLHEFLGERFSEVRIQIFATDLSEKAIFSARMGAYSLREMEGVSQARRERYFKKVDGQFQIGKNIRDLIVFSVHNIIKDPPFGNMDLVSCRNMLIYMEPFLQGKAFKTFHYALNESGFLILGKSESPGHSATLFNTIDKKTKIYKSNHLVSKSGFATHDQRVNRALKADSQETNKIFKDDYQKNAESILLAKYTPAGVIINENLDIVQFRGSTAPFLELTPGKASLNVLKMAREGLSFEIRNAVQKCKETNQPVIKEGIQLLKTGSIITIEVIPLREVTDPHFLILFIKTNLSEPPTESIGETLSQTAAEIRVQQLEKDLAMIREDMRAITEEQEASNEELQSANEELLSGSEELQSLNEELETSKEELQSTNEELITVNQELFERNEQFNEARLYAEGIISTIHEPLLVLTSDFRVKTANDSFYTCFNLSEAEIMNRNLLEIQNNEWDIPSLTKNLIQIKKGKAAFLEWEDIFSFGGTPRYLCINVQPILKANGEKLILMAFEDVTLKKEAESKLKMFYDNLEKEVLERTASLKKSNLDLEHSNKNLEQFASIASHDLQEPLRKIQVFAALLNKRHANDLSGDTKELLGKIVTSSDRMSLLIKDVLNFSRLNNYDIAFSATNLNTIIENVIMDFDLLIEERKARIEHKELPVIEAVPLQMNQLFYNLINNALKFSKADTPSLIQISSKTLNADEVRKYADLSPSVPYCEIVVKDNGIGFEQEYAKQIFHIFERLNSSKDYTGTGIGLAICQKIIDLHNGHIRAEGIANEGTSIFIILPLNQPAVPTQE